MDLKKGPALAQSDLGSPLGSNGTVYTACVYDDSNQLVAQLQVDRGGDLCAGRPCWTPLGAPPPGGSGYVYNDRERSSDGVQILHLLGGSLGKSAISIKGANRSSSGQTGLPVGIAGRLFESAEATVQIHVGEVGACFSARYNDVKRSTRQLFKAKLL